MPRVIIGMKPNEIAMQHAKQQLIPHRQDSVDFTTRKRGVKEEPDLNVLLAVPNLLPKHLWEQHQVVVMDPYQIPIFDFFRDGLCK